MSSPTLRASDLAQFTGSECWYRHPLYPSITYTDAAQYVAEAGGAYWLLDAIVSHQHDAACEANHSRFGRSAWRKIGALC